MKDIRFPDSEPQYAWSRECLGFGAIADGKPLECLVTAELLFSRFGAGNFSEAELTRAFHEHRDSIQEIARNLIENGWIDDEGRVFLTTHYTRLSASFDESLTKNEKVTVAHRVLLGIIGPSAGEIAVEWRTSPESPPNPAVLLSIKDPAIHREITTSFSPKVWGDPSALGVQLSLAWGALLSARSRDLVLKWG